MKRSIILWAAMMMIAISCEKAMPVTETSGIPMTLTATISSDETRLSFTDDPANKVIKTLWEAGDKVSVVSIGADNAMIANDIFTTESSGESVDFTGTFTGGNDAVKIMVYYPAMTESYSQSNGTNWGAPSYNGGYNKQGILYNICVGDKYIHRNSSNFLQRSADSPDHLKDLMILAGAGNMNDIRNNSLTVTMEHNLYVFKVNLTFPTEDDIIRHVELVRTTSTGSTGKDATISWSGWGYIYAYGGRSAGGYSNLVRMNLGDKITSQEMGSGVNIPSSKKLTVYIPAGTTTNGVIGVNTGDKFRIDCKGTRSSYSKTLTVASNTTFKRGMVYPVDVTF
ncbi:MAG: hypothetical protein IJT26_00335 [Bacteroidales bacterium]|nr:hypothetical protein [Bacteroidales bacterium]